MFMKIVIAFCMSFITCVGAFSENATKFDYWKLDIYKTVSIDQTFKSVSLFEGDTFGDFKNDFVVTFADGSGWKVHPKDRDAIGLWQPDDTIYVQARRGSYWFKREHKFMLYNARLKQAVAAMIVQYPQVPLVVTEVNLYLADENKFVPKEINGKTFKIRDWILNSDYAKGSTKIWNIFYRTKVKLSDGSTWIVEGDKTILYQVGSNVYISATKETNEFFFFLVSNRERNSRWVSAILEDSGL